MRRYFSQESQCRQAIKPKILCLGKMSKEKKNRVKFSGI